MNYPQTLLSLLEGRGQASDAVLPFALLEDVKADAGEPDSVYGPAVEELCRQASEILPTAPLTVTDKKHIAPSGDPHDFYSVGPYWWPDPEKADGVPYIRRDGQINPEFHDYDRDRLVEMCQTTATLAWAAYFTDNKHYAESALARLRVWFLDEATRMNPNFNYAQAIPGHCEGRGIGIIDSVYFATELLDAVDALREAFPKETAVLLPGLKRWFTNYTRWLVSSENGIAEAGEHNNHGTAYDVQVARFAVFLGYDAIVEAVLDNSIRARIDTQIEPDGSQPHELARTLSLGYTQFNLKLLLHLAQMARLVSHPLPEYVSADGRSIVEALEWMIPYYVGEKTWQWQQIKEPQWDIAFTILRMAGQVYQKPYRQYCDQLAYASDKAKAIDRSRLLYPS